MHAVAFTAFGVLICLATQRLVQPAVDPQLLEYALRGDKLRRSRVTRGSDKSRRGRRRDSTTEESEAEEAHSWPRRQGGSRHGTRAGSRRHGSETESVDEPDDVDADRSSPSTRHRSACRYDRRDHRGNSDRRSHRETDSVRAPFEQSSARLLDVPTETDRRSLRRALANRAPSQRGQESSAPTLQELPAGPATMDSCAGGTSYSVRSSRRPGGSESRPFYDTYDNLGVAQVTSTVMLGPAGADTAELIVTPPHIDPAPSPAHRVAMDAVADYSGSHSIPLPSDSCAASQRMPQPGPVLPVAEDPLTTSETISRCRQRLLRGVDAMRGNDQLVEFLEPLMRQVDAPKGHVFCEEGDYGDEMFIILRGKVCSTGRQRLPDDLGDGDYFGEAAAIMGCLRVQTCVAVVPTVCFTLKRDALLDACKEWPELRTKFHKRIIRRGIERQYTREQRNNAEIRSQLEERVAKQVLEFEETEKEKHGIQLDFVKSVGRGAAGDVWEAIRKDTGEHIAVKKVSTRAFEGRQWEQLHQETQLLQMLRHPNIVGGLGMMKRSKKQEAWILMELATCSIKDKLREESRFSEATARQYTADILMALSYLHSQRVLHRDIKPANVLIAQDGSLKLTDFGISRTGDLSMVTQHSTGTPNYMAPDVLEGHYSVQTDLWAVGCTMIEFLTGNPPWSHLKHENHWQLFRSIRSQTHPLPPNISPELVDVFRILMVKNAEVENKVKITAADVLAMPWFASYSQ